MIYTALIYFLVDHCLDRVDSRISSMMDAAQRNSSGLFECAGLVVGCTLVWLIYETEDGITHLVTKCLVLAIDPEVSEIYIAGIFEYKGPMDKYYLGRHSDGRWIKANQIVSYQSLNNQ